MSLLGKSNYGLSACQNCGNSKSPKIIYDDGYYAVACRTSPHKGCGFRGEWHEEEAFAVGAWNTVRETSFNKSLKPAEPELRPLNMHDKKQIRTYLDDRSFDGDTYIPDDTRYTPNEIPQEKSSLEQYKETQRNESTVGHEIARRKAE